MTFLLFWSILILVAGVFFVFSTSRIWSFILVGLGAGLVSSAAVPFKEQVAWCAGAWSICFAVQGIRALIRLLDSHTARMSRASEKRQEKLDATIAETKK